ncbi:MAG: TonB-dependent receptor [Gammaproteobacteria bacterium]
MDRIAGNRLAALLGVAASTLAVYAPAVSGQTTSADPIEEIVVTARRREESLLEVPVSVSAFTSGTIERLGANSIDDIARFTPGFSSNAATGRQPSSDRPSIRGITTIRNGIANSNVAATFVDGIYVGGSVQSTELYNLERVEIIRGPQAAQFGRGTFAGAINYVTRRPGAETESDVSITVGDNATRRLSAWISHPIIDDRLAVSIALGHRQYGGEYLNLRDGQTVGGESSEDMTTRFFWKPTENVDISVKLGFQQTDDDHFAIYLQPRTLNNCCERSSAAPRAREYFVGTVPTPGQPNLFTDLLDDAGNAGTQLRRGLAAIDFRWQLQNGATFTSLTGLVDDDVKRGFDSSYAAYDPLPFLQGSFTQLDRIAQRDFSQEARYSSSTRSGLQWTVGAYYYDGKFDDLYDNRVYLDDIDSVVTAPNFGALGRDHIENHAIFGSAEWLIGERWTVGAELRWATDEVSVTNVSNDTELRETENFSETFTSVTPRFTLNYRNNAGRSYYVNIAKGTNPGDFNSDVPTLSDGSPDERYRAVDEEQLWSYEVGVKGSWWQDRVTGSFAAYFSDVKDQQLTQIIELQNGSTASILQNVGRTEVRGFEAQLSTELTENIRVDATYAYTHARIRERISVEEADLQGSDGSAEQTRLLGSVAGKRVPRVPDHMASLVVSYERPRANGGRWIIGGDLSYESSKFAQEHNLIETGSRSVAGFRLGIASERWDATLRVWNAFDDQTPVDIIRYLDRRSGRLASFPQAGPGRASSSPRGFGIALPRGRQVQTSFRYRF